MTPIEYNGIYTEINNENNKNAHKHFTKILNLRYSNKAIGKWIFTSVYFKATRKNLTLTILTKILSLLYKAIGKWIFTSDCFKATRKNLTLTSYWVRDQTPAIQRANEKRYRRKSESLQTTSKKTKMNVNWCRMVKKALKTKVR